MTEDLFGQIALVLLVCVGLGLVAVRLHLPLLVGLLFAGVLVGPQVLGLVEATDEIELLGEIGISLLLFVVGLKLDPRLVRRLGPVVLVTGSVQVVVTVAIAAAIATGFGMGVVPSLYVAAGMAFSSTVVVVKLLTDRGQIEQLHGRIALGVLIVQDIVVVALMVALASFDPDSAVRLGTQLVHTALRGLVLLAGVALLARFVLPAALHLVARRAELLVLSTVTWAVGLAAIAVVLGFSAEVGAFVAGIALASSVYRDAITGRLATLRDFLLVFFFIDLGTRLRFEGADDLGLIIALSVFVLVGKPLLITAISTLVGFQSRVGARAGLTLAQVSEFSLILAALGVSLGHIEGRVAGVVAAVALVTITASTLVSDRAQWLVPLLARVFRGVERRYPRQEVEEPGALRPTVLVLGLGRLGRQVAAELARDGEQVLAVDFDPRRVEETHLEVPVMYGDLDDPELASQLPLERVRWVVSAARDPEANRTLVTELRRHGYRGRIAVAVEHVHEGSVLEQAGADVVVPTFHVAAAPLLDEVHAHDHDPAAAPHMID